MKTILNIPVYFHTNLDWYKEVYFPEFSGIIPRIGETVCVAEKSKEYCKHNNIPNRLKVVDVTYYSDYVTIELWYHENDIEAAKIGGTLNHLYKQ